MYLHPAASFGTPVRWTSKNQFKKRSIELGCKHTTNPLLWWKSNLVGHDCAAMVRKAIGRPLCVPDSSTPAERLFSAVGFLKTNRPSCMQPHTLGAVGSLHNFFMQCKNISKSSRASSRPSSVRSCKRQQLHCSMLLNMNWQSRFRKSHKREKECPRKKISFITGLSLTGSSPSSDRFFADVNH